MVLVLSRSRSVTPAENGSFDRSGASSGDYAAYSYVNMNSNRPPKILESPLDSKSLLSGTRGLAFIIISNKIDLLFGLASFHRTL